jgi:NitT/TauT family transport system substrate-binding protein
MSARPPAALLSLLACVLLACQVPASAPRSPAQPGAPAAPTAGGPAAPSAASAPAPVPPLAPPVPVAIVDNFTAAGVGLYVAMDQGYFAAEGLDVTLDRAGSAAEVYPQLAAGRYDVAGSAAGPSLFNAVHRGVRLKVVADQSSIPPQYVATSGIVIARTAHEAGRFPSVASLRGHKLAVASTGSSAEFGLLRVLEQAGVRRDEVDVTVVPFPELNAALVNGSVDAGWQAEPFLTAGLKQGLIHRLIGSEDPTGVVHAAAIITYGEEFITRKPEAAERFMVAYLRGIRDNYEAFFGSRRGREAVIAALANYTAVKDPALYEEMAVQHQDPDGYVPLEGLRRIAEWSVAAGYTQQPVDVDALVDHRYVDKALQRLGRYQPTTAPAAAPQAGR